MTDSVIVAAHALAITDLNTNINHEPRISHIRLSDMLGVADHRAILRLIERNAAELQRYGEISVTVTENTDAHGRGRPGKTYWPNEGQALVICALSRTPQAAAIRHQIIKVYMEWRRAQVPATVTDTNADTVTARLTMAEQFMLATFRTAVDGAMVGALDRAAADFRSSVGGGLTALVQRELDTALSRHCSSPSALKTHRPAPPRGPNIAGKAGVA